jgi:hypothetical protein
LLSGVAILQCPSIPAPYQMLIESVRGMIMKNALEALALSQPAMAEKAAPATLTHCATLLGTIAPASGAALRALRSGTALAPTGKRDGLLVEVADNFGANGFAVRAPFFSFA